MNVRERLQELKKLDTLINCKLRQYEKCHFGAISGQSQAFDTEGVQALGQEINADIDRLCDLKNDIMDMVDSTSSLTAEEVDVLYRHYLEGKSYKQIAKEIYCTKTTAYRICQNAVDKVVDRWENT